MSVSVLLFQSFHWWYLQVQTAKVTSRVFAIKASGWNNHLPEAQRFTELFTFQKSWLSDSVQTKLLYIFSSSFPLMSALCCIMYLCKFLMWISWDRFSKTKNPTLLAKVAKNHTVNFNSDCVSRVATVGYFSCFVENLPNSKTHSREQKKNPKEEEEESKIKWKAIVTSTRQWNNKNDYLNIYIWLKDHCVILYIIYT